MATTVAVLSTPLPELPRDVSPPLRRIVVKSLARTPEDRYASAAELREALVSLGTPRWRRMIASVFRR